MTKQSGVASETIDTYNKALAINLDPTIFGVFAEIGAGQETARWFMRVGGASGTVAKTISAYDKVVSDDLYGSGTRYVSKQRLTAMLDSEWRLLQKQLVERSSTSRTFAYANTVSARNYSGTNQCHGWVGLRYLRRPGGEISELVLHVNLRGQTNVSQQETLGLLGVNLIYAAYFEQEQLPHFLATIGQDLDIGEIEIDYLEARGALFADVEQRELLIALVSNGLTEGVVLSHAGEYVPMNEVFHKLPVVVEPGRFEQREAIHIEMLKAAQQRLREEQINGEGGVLGLFCLAANDRDADATSPLPASEIRARTEALLGGGFDVLFTVHRELYKIAALIGRFTSSEVRLVIGVSVVIKMLASAYAELEGRTLEGVARLFAKDLRVYVYPMAVENLETRLTAEETEGWTIAATDGLLDADEIRPPAPLGYLYSYLLASRLIEPLKPIEQSVSREPRTELKVPLEGSKAC